MKKVLFIITIILLSGILSSILFQFHISSNIYILLMSIYWVFAGILYFRNKKRSIYLPFLILTIYTVLTMFLQIRYAVLKMVITLRKLTVWTNFGFLPLFELFHIPKHSMEVYTYIVYGIVYFIMINLLFYLGYLLVNKGFFIISSFTFLKNKN